MSQDQKKLWRWTIDEDQMLVELLAEYVLNQGMAMTDAIPHIAEHLNRTPNACVYRWHTSIKKHLPADNELLIRLAENNPSHKLFKAQR